MFGKKTDPKKQIRQQQRQLTSAQREADRDIRALERQEQQIQNEIKKAAKTGDKQTLTILAKQLIGIRKQKTRMLGMKGQIGAVKTKTTTMQSNMKMAQTMKNTAGVMGQMNKQMNPQEMAKVMQSFERESAKMDMTGEMMEDTLDSALCESGDEEESDQIMNQVLDEIGIEIKGKMDAAPAAGSSSLAGPSRAGGTRAPTDEDIEAQLKRLAEM